MLLFIHIISYVYQVIQLRLTSRELYYDEISDDEISDDEISYDEISRDEISDDEFSDDEISGNRSKAVKYLKLTCPHNRKWKYQKILWDNTENSWIKWFEMWLKSIGGKKWWWKICF